VRETPARAAAFPKQHAREVFPVGAKISLDEFLMRMK
jgi:hypothetical protein